LSDRLKILAAFIDIKNSSGSIYGRLLWESFDQFFPVTILLALPFSVNPLSKIIQFTILKKLILLFNVIKINLKGAPLSIPLLCCTMQFLEQKKSI